MKIQSFFIPGTLYSHDLEPNGSGFRYNSVSISISFRVPEALLVMVQELVFFKMVAAEPVAAEL